MSTIKHQPATPLPFAVEQPSGHLYLKGSDGALVAGPFIGAISERQDLAYIAHTANTYPKLVEALRRIVELQPDGKYSAATSSARAILRELGE